MEELLLRFGRALIFVYVCHVIRHVAVVVVTCSGQCVGARTRMANNKRACLVQWRPGPSPVAAHARSFDSINPPLGAQSETASRGSGAVSAPSPLPPLPKETREVPLSNVSDLT